jgi:hypothetical protein
MQSLWQSETGQLMCRWSEIGPRDSYSPPWMKEALAAPSGYLAPLTDFASRSPFGGVAWFQPNPNDSE